MKTQIQQYRFWSKVKASGKCLEWIGARTTDGYGQFWNGSKVKRAHRYAYENFVQPIPEGMELDHTCYNRACVNTEHMKVVSRKENTENRSGSDRGSFSGIRGVYLDKKSGSWRACVTHNGKRYNIGSFEKKEDAQRAVIAKRNELFTNNLKDRI